MRDYQPDEPIAGTVYRVVKQIGAGGMGTVYEVEDTSIGKHYVLKTLHPQLGTRGDLARRMENEARTLARLSHPHIVEVITAGITRDDLRLPYFVMERLNGQSLRAVVQKKGRLELPHAYHIQLELLDALEYAHNNGVIHRDVKPDNIFLHRGPSGVTTTKLLDFGIVSLLDVASRDTGGRFLGTLRYAAPEQLRGERATPKVDVYAAGLVLYEMVAGHGPFDDEKESRQVAAAHLEKPAPPLSRFVRVPPELEAIVASALAKSPHERPRDAYSFAAALRNARRVFGVEADAEAHVRTESAVMDSGASPAEYVKVSLDNPAGPVVIAPAKAVLAVAERVDPLRTPLPANTLLGMTPPTEVAGLTGATPTATTPESVDRDASTHTLAPQPSGVPAHGTEPFPTTDTTTVPYAIASRERDEEALPADPGAPPALGEGPLVLAREPRQRRGRAAFLVVGASSLVAVLVLASVLSVVRRSSPVPASAVVEGTPAASAILPAAPPAPSAVSVEVTTGPSAAAPVTESSAEGVTAPAVPLSPGPRPADGRDRREKGRAPVASQEAEKPVRVSGATPHAGDRPGPGF